MGKQTQKLIGSQLANLYKPESSAMPLQLIELLARLAVAEAMSDYDRQRSAR